MAKKDASVKQRILAIAFILILAGSTLAYGLIAFFRPGSNYSIPKERIINYKLNQVQVALLVQNYFTVVEYNYTNSCLECIQVKNYLEELTQNSDGQIYLQEILVDDKPRLYIINALNETIIDNPMPSQAIDAVCNSLISTPVWCAINRI
jgi:hypothetical protein